ncbi:MAG: SDR family NAD(P)-dependent oxidoreductase, partial [Desulfuromusa sp.]|nr:SDR family NAD(P)-dependent oxidoreductase [Desulfuromusa sp.]
MVQDKVALVTGASRGIGRSIALALAAQGAKIVAVDVDLQATEDFVAELKAAGTEAVAVQGNVTAAADVEQMVKIAKETFD